MALSYDLISQFAKLSKEEKRGSVESTVYGTVKVDGNGNKYVKLDGTDQLTPVTEENQPGIYSAVVNAKDGERVSVLIKDHTATVTGNVSSPSATTGDVKIVENYFKKLIADEATIGKLVAAEASITELLAKSAEIDELLAGKITVTDLIAKKIDADLIVSDGAVIESLKASNADILSLIAERAVIDKLIAEKITVNDLIAKKIDADLVVADKAVIDDLESKNIDVLTLFADKATVDRLIAENANLKQLITEDADIKYANIDFTNIGEAAINRIFADSGLIRDIVIGDGSITGELVGVTIKGDLIEGNTIVADKLVIKGDDGLYYKLNTDGETVESEQTDQNSLNGNIITAKSITATKINVNDLVAFDATIGGFNITTDSIYSGVKEDVHNTTRGVYLDREGQFAVGDGTDHIKYFRVSTAEAQISNNTIVVRRIGSNGLSAVINDNHIDLLDTSMSNNVDARIFNGVASLDSGSYKLEISAESITTQINAATNPLNDTADNVKKHITFSEDGILISSGPNNMAIRIDNDIVVFEKNGLQFGWWDGIDFHTGNISIDVTERAQFGNFAFVPRSDGSLSLLKVDHRTGMYARPIGRTIIIYGYYPTFENNVMTVDADNGSIEGVTLTLGGYENG